jgi:hypothetical protein
MSKIKLVFMVFHSAVGGTIGIINSIDKEVKTLRRYNFRILPDIFQIGARISLGAGAGAICGLLWPAYGGILAYNFLDEQSKLG